MSTFAWVRLRSSLNLQAHVSSNLLLLTLTYLEETQRKKKNQKTSRKYRQTVAIECSQKNGQAQGEYKVLSYWSNNIRRMSHCPLISVYRKREDRALLREAKQEDTQIPYFRQDRTMVEWRSLRVSTERWVWKHKQPSSCWVLRPCFKARAESQRQQMALARS